MNSYAWLFFALVTVATWGLYGIFLHQGQVGMGDPVNGRYKAFLWVGIAYFLVAVLAPVAILVVKQASWEFPAKGAWISLFAGTLGAIGAFFVLLAMGSGMKNGAGPAVVMSIIFAGAPIVNSVVAVTMDKKWGSVQWPFMLGILMAAAGGFLVVRFKPSGHGPPPQKPEAVEAAIPDITIPGDKPDDIDRAA